MAPELDAPPASSQRWLWALLTAVLAGTLVSGIAWTRSRPDGVSGGAPSEGLAPPGEQVPDFSLVAEDGKPFRRADLMGKAWVAGFIFTRCTTICPKVVARMAGLQDAGVALVTFSVDPHHDTPEVLKQYAEAHGARTGRWRFLTGEREALYRLIGEGFRLSVAENPHPADAGDLITHSDRLVLVDKRLRIRGTYSSGDPEAMGRLRRDLDALAREP